MGNRRLARAVTVQRATAWIAGSIGAAVLLVALVVAALRSPELVLGGMLAVALIIGTAVRPMFGVIAWLAVLIVVPDWTPISGVGGLKPISLIGICVLIGVLVSRRRQRTSLAWPDVALLASAVLLGVLTVLASYPLILLANLAGTLIVSYALGRFAPGSARRAYAYAMVIVAVWGILEFATGTHVFEEWGLTATQHWNEIQSRAGFDRSEAGFGHAIAYGAALAMAIPFARELPKHPAIAQVILVAGIIVSFSRGPYLALALTLGLVVIFASSGRRRLAGALFFLAAMVAVFFAFQLLGDEDDSATTALSGEQRLVQLMATLPHVQWFGAESITVEDGRVTGLGSTVIDNTFLRLAINFGWIVAVLILAPLMYAGLNLLRGRATAASMALVGQIPVLAVTTLITQWQAAVFFVAGIAVTELAALHHADKPARVDTAEQRKTPATIRG